MSKIGFYRWKVENAVSEPITLYINNVAASTKYIVAKDVCNGFKLLKFMDNNGHFRFYPFVPMTQIIDKPKQIGTVNNIVASLIDSNSDKRNVGYTNERTIKLAAKNVSADELEKLSDIYTSPRVYLYTGDLSKFKQTDWIEVTVSGDNVVQRAKRNFGTIELTVTLPEHHTITMR